VSNEHQEQGEKARHSWLLRAWTTQIWLSFPRKQEWPGAWYYISRMTRH